MTQDGSRRFPASKARGRYQLSLGEIFSRLSEAGTCFVLSVSLHQKYTSIFIYMLLLPDKQTAKPGILARAVLFLKSGKSE